MDTASIAAAIIIAILAEMRLSIHRIGKRTKSLARRVYALENGNALEPDTDQFNKTPLSLRARSGVSLFLAAAMLATLSGCGQVDVAKVRSEIDAAKATVATLQLAAEQLHNLAISNPVPALVQASAAADKALDEASRKIPELEAKLKDLGDRAPAWKVALAFAVPLVPRLMAIIPGLGLLAEPIARAVSEFLWSVAATKKQKAEDDAGRKTPVGA